MKRTVFMVPSALLVALVVHAAHAAHILIDLKRGDPLPALSITSTDADVFNTADLRGHVQVYLFAQSGQENSQAACQLINNALADPQLDGVAIKWVYVLSKMSDPAALEPCWEDSQVKPIVVHDVDRQVFGAFGVITVPSVVIADETNHATYVLAGLSPNFGDIVSNALLLAAHQIDEEQFDQAIHPANSPLAANRVRAQRLVKLARQASRRGLDEMARTQYTKAAQADPTYIQAQLGLGHVLRKLNELDQAQQVFERLIDEYPTNPDAKLGLASVLIAKGKTNEHDELDRAQRIIGQVLNAHPENARGQYVLGLLYAQREDWERAAASFKASARLQLHADDPDQMLGDE